MKLDSDDFALFGLPRRFALDAAALAERWRALQSEVHPDRFTVEGAAAQRVAMQWAVRVNEAYRRLKDPLARALYLCELAGQAVDPHDRQAMPAAMLMRQIEWREQLEQAASADAVHALDGAVQVEIASAQAAVAADLDQHADAAAAAARLREWMFLARLREDVERRLERLEA
ncbi:MAG: Fe-S protein assembly co-chaperone HscB [Ideonella sp.]|nr:Fe-S protein assembly co-chaperone HscB [Ideonella sp.]MCC7459284.1 Fe-S protein assembly co-chaperone HscB [Nitrospira sp.]